MTENNRNKFDDEYNSKTSSEINKELLFWTLKNNKLQESIKNNVQIITFIVSGMAILTLFLIYLYQEELF